MSRWGVFASAVGIACVAGASGVGALVSSPALASSHAPAWAATPPIRAKVVGRLADGKPRYSSAKPTGLPPSAIASVYHLSDLKAPASGTTGSGYGQTIAIVDAYHDPNALSDLNTWNRQYKYPTLSTCASTTTGPCFLQKDPEGTPKSTGGWAFEESLDIEWAHAEAPNARIVLVEAASNSDANLFTAVKDAVSLYHATEVSMSWGGNEFSTESSDDADMSAAGVFYTASAGDSGHGAEYPAASPHVLAVGGTTLTGCSGTSCSGFTSETAWSGSGGGVSADEPLPSYQGGYTGPVSGSATINGLTGGFRGIPDVSFDANPNTGVSIYDSTRYQGQSGWFTVGGTSVGAPNWAGILAAGATTGGALQGATAIYRSGYSGHLRDVTGGTNGNCGTDCTAGTGYDLVTGLGSPIASP